MVLQRAHSERSLEMRPGEGVRLSDAAGRENSMRDSEGCLGIRPTLGIGLLAEYLSRCLQALDRTPGPLQAIADLRSGERGTQLEARRRMVVRHLRFRLHAERVVELGDGRVEICLSVAVRTACDGD